jgi:AcrR family transcriptional regulator
MTMATPSRRERLREATVAEIKQSARRLLVEGGLPAMSLRAIGREMGMTAPAIYRYFESLTDLTLALVTDLFGEMTAAVERAAAEHAGDPPLTRIGHMARAFRAWSLANRAEFGLVFGSPLPGLAERWAELDEGGARFCEAFFRVLDEQHATRPFEVRMTGAAELSHSFQPYFDAFGDRFPLPVVTQFVSCWARVYGLIAMEAFGQLHWAVTDAGPLFELELERTLRTLAR